jgi:hypothetical protein
MTLWAVLARWFRQPTDRRARSPARARGDSIFPFDAVWADLLVQLGLPPSALRDVLESGSLHPHFHYRDYTRPKKGGGRREINEPDSKLKRVQQEILTRYLASGVPHPAAVAYRKGHSTAQHVWPHAGAEVIVTADVTNFFPTTSAGRIEDWWRSRVEGDLAQLLTQLTTYHGGLPQGAPTSPALSNLVNCELDERLTRRAEAAGARYTRYCDDLAFSWPDEVGPSSDFEPAVRATLHEFGYTLHPQKGWRVYHRRDEPKITGVILTRHGAVRLPDNLRRVMRQLGRSKNPRDIQRLKGYQGYEAMVTQRPDPRPTPRPAQPTAAPPPQHLPVRRPPVVPREEGEEEIPF